MLGVEKKHNLSPAFKAPFAAISLLAVLMGGLEASASTDYYRAREGQIEPVACTDTPRLDSAMGPSRSQTNSQWCYAFETADQLAHILGRPVSAADVALIYNEFELERGPNSRRARAESKQRLLHTQMQEGGDPRLALGWMLKKGVCLEQDFPSEGYLVRRSNASGEELRLISILAEIEEYQRQIRESRDKDCVVCAEYIVRQRDIFAAVFPHLSDSELMQILKRADEYSVLTEMQAKNCDSRRIKLPTNIGVKSIRGYPGEKFDTMAQENIIRRLDRLLTDKQPVGISVMADFMGLNRDLGMHALTVIGRRFNSRLNRCEYLMRDSDPGNCQRAVNRDGKNACDENGNWWISREQMNGKIDELTYLYEKPPEAALPHAPSGNKQQSKQKKK